MTHADTADKLADRAGQWQMALPRLQPQDLGNEANWWLSDDEQVDEDQDVTEQEMLRSLPPESELFLDPQADAHNTAWLDRRNSRYLAPGVTPRTSDAILNCPRCLAVLSTDCQRHAVYQTQYRAMFVQSVRVIASETLTSTPQATTNASSNGSGIKIDDRERVRSRSPSLPRSFDAKMSLFPGMRELDETEASSISRVYHPVQCEQCSEYVAVVDVDEVFHFFNVLASRA